MVKCYKYLCIYLQAVLHLLVLHVLVPSPACEPLQVSLDMKENGSIMKDSVGFVGVIGRAIPANSMMTAQSTSS